jgi:hypothetical protein
MILRREKESGSRRRRIPSEACVLAMLPGLVLAYPQGAWANGKATEQSFVYSVKFLCGIQPQKVSAPPAEPPVKPGNYATAINIHNFHQGVNAPFCKKAVLAPQEPVAGKPGNFRNLLLPPDSAMEVDCSDIVDNLQVCGSVRVHPSSKGLSKSEVLCS